MQKWERKLLERISKFDEISRKELNRQISMIRLDKDDIKKIIKDLEFIGIIKKHPKRKDFVIIDKKTKKFWFG